MFEPKITVDKALFARIEKVAEARGYSSPREFVLDVLERAVREAEETISEEEVARRLEGLGYLG